MTRAAAVKILKTAEVEKFYGEGKGVDPEEFLDSVDEEVREGRMADCEILSAISSVLRKGAKRWWRANREDIFTWAEFKTQFKLMYLKDYDEEDL